MGGADAETDQRMPLSRVVLKVIALDFDGTLVESNHIKDHAFETIFSDWPDHRRAMMKWHLARNGVERREKFRYFVEKVLDRQGDEELIEKLTAKFSRLTREAIINCSLVDGAMEFLKYFHGNIPLFLISATPQNELNKVLKKRCLDGYFEKAYGAPINKVHILNEIMNDQKASPDEVLYIGDSPEDQQAAVSLGVHFIGRMSDRVLGKGNTPAFPELNKVRHYAINQYAL